MYLVLKSFLDLETGRRYQIGEEYPAKGHTASEERIKALLSGKNKACMKLIKEVKASLPKEEPEAQPKEEPKEAKPKAKTTKSKAKAKPKAKKTEAKASKK